jgi:membrane protease YdiL (CAAX protease family)
MTPRRTGTVGRFWAAFTAGPAYPAEPGDLRTIVLVGLRLPVRASVAVAVVTFALLFDYSRTFIPGGVNAGRGPDAMLATALERVVLFGLVPLAVVVLGFRDRPGRYGLTFGEWRWGAALVVIGCAVMTPIVLWFAGQPDARAFYGPSTGSPGQVVLTDALDLTASEFAFRGFLMLTLVRLIGPFGVLVATMPFVFAHLGKPELELFSTLGGGLVYGWLAWRTRSIVWGSIGHTYILSLLTLAAGG